MAGRVQVHFATFHAPYKTAESWSQNGKLGKIDSMLQHGIALSRKPALTTRGISTSYCYQTSFADGIKRKFAERDGIKTWNQPKAREDG